MITGIFNFTKTKKCMKRSTISESKRKKSNLKNFSIRSKGIESEEFGHITEGTSVFNRRRNWLPMKRQECSHLESQF